MARKTVLFLSPHTDDAEIACGGTIARMVKKGHDVHYTALSACETSVPDKYPCDILRSEVRKATTMLGVKPKNVQVDHFEVRKFPLQRQEILESLVRLNTKINPDIIVAPSSYDLHQDHITTRDEVLRAFRKSTILGFEMPWDNISFNTQAFVPLTEENIQQKIKAIDCYKSQKHRPYLIEDCIRGLANTRGMQIKSQYAEAFEVMRWVMNDV